MKKALSCLLLCALMTIVPVQAMAFSDVPQWEWYHSYIADLSEKGVIAGYEDGTFRPDGTVTWGEALKLILLAAGQAEQPANEAHWAGGYLNLALQWGILPVGPQYDLDAPINRQQVAQIAARALGLRAVLAENPFADCSDPEVLALYEAGIIAGMEINGQMCFAGTDNLLRSQISAIIWRIDAWVAKEDAPEELPTVEELQPEEAPILPQQPQSGGILDNGGSWQPVEDLWPEPPVQPEIPQIPVRPSEGQITYNGEKIDVLERFNA